MVTAGQLYSKIKEKEISLETITPILPEDARETLEQGKMPCIELQDSDLNLQENECLHYLENMILFMPNADIMFSKQYGIIYITGQRIVVRVGNNSYEIPIDKLSKIFFYEAMPKILEIVGNNYVLFLQTADVAQTYEVSKILMKSFEKNEEVVDMEKYTIEYFTCANLESYIFRLKSIGEYIKEDSVKESRGKP